MWWDWIHHAITSNGAVDQYRPVLLGADGKLDVSLMGTRGTFTPTLLFGGGNTGMTYTTQLGDYLRLADIVFISLRVYITAKGSSTGNATIGGLPVTAHSTKQPQPLAWRAVGVTLANVTPVFQMLANTTTIGCAYRGTAGGSVGTLTDADFAATTVLDLSGFYIAS